MLKFNPFKSMTLQGVLLAAGTYLWAHVDPTAFSPTMQAIVNALAAVWTALGLRNAIAKNGSGV
jgi:hypothetical protein